MRVLLRSTSMIGMAMLLLSLAISAYAGPFEEGQTAAAAGDYAKAFELWRPLAKKGNVAAQDSLGVMYYYGRGVKKDYEESMDWFRKAAKQGDAMAQRELGIMYNRGRGDDQDLEDGAKWIRLAAEQGDAKAECMMGELLQNGLGVPVNPAEAEKWYLAAAQQNHVRAQIHVGSILLDRSPCRKRAPAGWRGAKPRSTLNCPCPDDTTAVKWYRLAASQNDPLGVRYLAIIDSLAFESVRNTHAASAYEQYLLLYPSGQYATAAADSLAALDFAAAKKANTLDAFYQFLARHPEGPDAEEAMGTVAMRLGPV